MRRRRGRVWLRTALSVVVALGMAAAVGWFIWLPRYRPALHSRERYGIDVSEHQGTVDWARVARDHITFAYIKATEGQDFTDRRFAANWAGAREARLDHGAYHFFTLCSPGGAQARHFLDALGTAPSTLAPAVDLELKGNCRARPNSATVHEQLNAFLSAVEDASGRQVVLYVGDDFDSRYHIRRNYGRPLWQRRLLRRPSDDWTIWQVHGRADVAGIHGPVDLDIARSRP